MIDNHKYYQQVKEEKSEGVTVFGKTFFKGPAAAPKSLPVALPCVIDGPPEMLEALLK